MIEMGLSPSKETESKLRWSIFVEKDAAEFKLYIPKWRVPKPWPGRIYVGIQSFTGDLSTVSQSLTDLVGFDNPIRELIVLEKDHTQTKRFAPLGDSKDWHIGKPYIPFSLIPRPMDYLIIDVQWDLESKGQFINVPTYREDPKF
ncbi:MAG: hypothetical protein IH946_07635 [Bacteroidetes bacterium]|nr:hypothetical protein [Bacteroidota bacterium]